MWTATFWPSIGGVESHLGLLLPALVERGHRLRVITEDTGGASSFFGIPIHRLAFKSALRSPTPLRLAEIRHGLALARTDWSANVIHVSCLGPEAFFLPRPPQLVTLHAVPPPQSLSEDSLLGATVRRSAWTNCVSQAVHASLLRQIPELAGRSSVIHHGLTGTEGKSRCLIPYGKVVCLGRLSHEKGFDLALEALARMGPGSAHIKLGVAGDGPQRGTLQRLAEQLGLGRRVEFPGWVAPEAVQPFLEQADLVVVPSRDEAFGLTALEAAFAQRPVVAARIGGLPEVVLEGKTGLLVPPGDAGAMAEAMEYLLTHPEIARAMGREAARIAHKRFPLSRCVDRYEDLFTALASGKSTPG